MDHIGDDIGIDSGKERVYPLCSGAKQQVNGRIFTNQIRAEAFNPADFNADCAADLNDFATFAPQYGLACPPGW